MSLHSGSACGAALPWAPPRHRPHAPVWRHRSPPRPGSPVASWSTPPHLSRSSHASARLVTVGCPLGRGPLVHGHSSRPACAASGGAVVRPSTVRTREAGLVGFLWRSSLPKGASDRHLPDATQADLPPNSLTRYKGGGCVGPTK